jgi:hypothetical protein
MVRAVTGARDAQSALDALTDLCKTDLPFSPASSETIRTRLTEMRDAAEAKSFTKNMRGRLSRYLDYATLSLERWPLKAIDFDIVTDGLTSTYRRAQQLVPDSWSDAEGISPAHDGAVVGAPIQDALNAPHHKKTAAKTGGRLKSIIVLRRSERPWQAWQRPTLPSLEA